MRDPSIVREDSQTLVQLFLKQVSRYGNRQALFFKDRPGGNYLSISWEEWGDRTKKVALGLHALGVKPKDRVGILSENRPEWTIADLGVLSLGALDVPIYPSCSSDDVAYILQNAEIEVLFVSNAAQLEKVLPLFKRCSLFRKVICFDKAENASDPCLTLEALLEMGKKEFEKHPSLYNELVQKGTAEDLATLIYTSGTTGPPKGVMLTHQNFIANILGSRHLIPMTENDLALSFLPLSHVFERMAGYYYMIFHGTPIAYAESMQTVADDVAVIRPTVAAAVPRFYEKVYGKIFEKVDAASPLQKRLFYWALGVGREWGNAKQSCQTPSLSLRIQHRLATLLVLKKIKARLGGRIRFFISGSAPLSKELSEFFFAAGILILEGYGLTETSPVISVNAVDHFKFGTVGRPIPGVQVKIAEDGEILTKGPCVMKGYYKNEGATREVLKDGWFYTGDIGKFDEQGFLKITDRKKDIIKTSGGKMVSAQNIENQLLADKLFSQIVIVGDKRPYLVALIVPNRLEVEHYAKEKGIQASSWAELLKHPDIESWVDGRIREKIKNQPSFEQIKYFTLLENEFSQAAGDLTPTLKIKRRHIQEKFKDTIDELYKKGNAYVPSTRNAS